MNVVNNSRDVIHSSGIVFGTSGARGLVKILHLRYVLLYGFICCRYAGTFSFDTVALAIDNRPSSYGMAQVCAAALADKALTVFLWVVPA